MILTSIRNVFLTQNTTFCWSGDILCVSFRGRHLFSPILSLKEVNERKEEREKLVLSPFNASSISKSGYEAAMWYVTVVLTLSLKLQILAVTQRCEDT